MSSICHQTFEFSPCEETALAVDELSQICEGLA
ncbi:AraC family transcriptional regulator, partial [Escherichia coli]